MNSKPEKPEFSIEHKTFEDMMPPDPWYAALFRATRNGVRMIVIMAIVLLCALLAINVFG
jgi:hypothetical protein